MQTVTPTKKGELVQSGNNQPEAENVQVGLWSPASTCEAAAWIACSSSGLDLIQPWSLLLMRRIVLNAN